MIKLVTRADDAGVARSANTAILDSCTKGIARNISLMACAPEIEHAAELLNGMEHVSYGMHITLNCEWDFPRFKSLLDIPYFLDNDGFLTRSPQALHERQIKPEKLLDEVKAQLERLRSLGFNITYMDEHMGIGWICSSFVELLHDLAEQEKLIFRPCFQDLGMSNGNNRLEQFKSSLQTAGSGNYLFLAHPVYPGGDFYDFVRNGQTSGQEELIRDNQRQCFMEKEIIDIIKKRNIEILRYEDLV